MLNQSRASRASRAGSTVYKKRRASELVTRKKSSQSGSPKSMLRRELYLFKTETYPKEGDLNA